MKSQYGFTLVEVLVVIAIIAILVGFAGISGKTWLDRYRVESQMKTMFADLMSARINAMQKNRTYFVTLSSAATYTIYEDRDPADTANPPALDGDGVLQTDTDSVVTRTDVAYSIMSDAAEIDFSSSGLVSAGLVGTETTIRVVGSFGSAYDCIAIQTTKTRMGKWNGADCDVQ